MNRLTRAYVQFYWNSNRDVLLSKDTEHHTDIIEGLRKKDAATVIEFIRLDLHNFGGFRTGKRSFFARRFCFMKRTKFRKSCTRSSRKLQ